MAQVRHLSSKLEMVMRKLGGMGTAVGNTLQALQGAMSQFTPSWELPDAHPGT